MLSRPGRTGWIPIPPALRKLLYLGLLLTLSLAAGADGQEKAKGKPKSEVATDPAKAGPDFSVQGEYLGDAGKAKLGAEVIARGDGKFDVNFLPGGLRGEGGDYAKRIQATAKGEGGKAVVTSKDGKWTATIEYPVMTGKAPGGERLSLAKVIRKGKTLGQAPPTVTGAVVLFDGNDAGEWNNGKMVNGNLLGSDIASKKKFKDHKVHLEFRLSYMPYARGQGRSNSGVYVQHRYEIQVLDSFGLKGENNECGGVYGQSAPLVNMCYPPLQWQTYDIEFRAARFKDAKKVEDALLTVRHNGVLVHNRLKLKGPTGGGTPETDTPGPLYLQGHGGQVQYRNIWVVEYDKAEKR
jgi:hypothetical protein